jgi:hypothetical protein
LTSTPLGVVVLCCISVPFETLSTTQGKVTHVLLTRAPLYWGRIPFSLDLHVLGAPLTFVLSQDQTLQLKTGEKIDLADSPKCIWSLVGSNLFFIRNSQRFTSGCSSIGTRRPNLEFGKSLRLKSVLPLLASCFPGAHSSFF